MAWIGRIAAAAVIVIAAGTAWLWVQRNASNEIGKVESIDNQEITLDVQTDQIRDPSIDNQTLEIRTDKSQTSEIPTSEIRTDKSQSPDYQSPGRETLAEVEVRSDGDRISSISRFQLPVEDPGTETLQAMYTGGDQSGSSVDRTDREETESGEGIDVFEEFGEKKSNDYNKWAVGGQVTPLYSYRNLEPVSQDYASATPPSYTYSSSNAQTGSYNEFENGMLSYAGGVNVNYSPAKRLSLQSGIYYSRMGMTITNSFATTYDGQDKILAPIMGQQAQVENSTGAINQGDPYKRNAVVSNIVPPTVMPSDQMETDTWSNAGPVVTPEITEGDVLQQFEYLEVPLIARYRIVDRRLGLNVLGGLSTNFLVGNNVYFQEGDNKEHIGTTEEIKPINYSSVLGIGLQYSISRNLNLNMEPTFRYYLNSVNTGSGPGSHPYSLGFFTGISYSF